MGEGVQSIVFYDIFGRALVCWPLPAYVALFVVLESCRSKQARYQLSPASPYFCVSRVFDILTLATEIYPFVFNSTVQFKYHYLYFIKRLINTPQKQFAKNYGPPIYRKNED